MGLKLKVDKKDVLKYMIKETLRELLEEYGLTPSVLRELPTLNQKIDNLEKRFIENYNEKEAFYTKKIKADTEKREKEKLEKPEKYQNVSDFVESFNKEIIDFEGV